MFVSVQKRIARETNTKYKPKNQSAKIIICKTKVAAFIARNLKYHNLFGPSKYPIHVNNM